MAGRSQSVMGDIIRGRARDQWVFPLELGVGG